MRYAIVTLSIILASLLGFVAASCGTGNGAQSAGPVPSGSESPSPQTYGPETDTGTESGSLPIPTDTSGQGSALVRYKVWFHRGEQLFVVTRTQSATPRVGTAAMEALLRRALRGSRDADPGRHPTPGTDRGQGHRHRRSDVRVRVRGRNRLDDDAPCTVGLHPRPVSDRQGSPLPARRASRRRARWRGNRHRPSSPLPRLP
jgi:hypothetical protein